MSSEGWKSHKLGELVKVKGGKRLPKGASLQETQNAHPYIRVSDMGNRIIDKSKLLYVPDQIFTSISRYIVNDGDIILSIVGTIGLISKITADLDNANLTENCVKITDFEGVLREFLYYYLISENCQKEIKSKTVGTTQPKLPLYNINSLQIIVPPIFVQHRIADILSALDEKIELNRQTNAALEAIAQAIFKEWFVDFNYPGATGEMVDSHLGPIPKGWSLEKIGNILKTMLGGTPSTKRKEYWENGNIPWINSGKVNEFRIIEPTTYITEEALNSSNTKLLPKRTVVIAITGATLGQFSLLEIDACANQSVIGILENVSLPSEYIYLWIASNINNIISNQSGGAQQHINTNDVNNSLILIPDRQVLSKFYEVILPIFDRQSQLCFESASLTKIRDLLLPQLMKGNINL